MKAYTLFDSDLENNADIVKVVTLRALVKEGLLTNAVADEWACTHTVIIRSNPFLALFHKVIKGESREKEYIMVKRV